MRVEGASTTHDKIYYFMSTFHKKEVLSHFMLYSQCMRLPVFHFIMPVSHGFYVMRTMGHVLTPKLFLSLGFSNLTVATSADLVFYLSQ